MCFGIQPPPKKTPHVLHFPATDLHVLFGALPERVGKTKKNKNNVDALPCALCP